MEDIRTGTKTHKHQQIENCYLDKLFIDSDKQIRIGQRNSVQVVYVYVDGKCPGYEARPLVAVPQRGRAGRVDLRGEPPYAYALTHEIGTADPN